VTGIHRTNSNIDGSILRNLRKGEGSTYPKLCLALRSLMLNEVIKDAYDRILDLPEITERVRREVKFYRVTGGFRYRKVVGVDAGSQRVPLASSWFAIIAALAFQLPDSVRFFKDPEVVKMSYDVSKEKFHEVISLRRERKLFETASEFILRSKPDLILIDGPLAFGNWWAMKGEESDRRALIDAINNLISICAKTQVSVAGVVKRTTARYLVNHLKLGKEVSIPDSYLLLQMMKVGDRTEVFSPSEALKREFRAAPFMDKIAFPIHSFYIKTSNSDLTPPIRIDVPEFMLDEVDELSSYCLKSAVLDGIPLPIIKADEEVRITKRFVSQIYSEVVAKANRTFGTASLVASIWGEML